MSRADADADRIPCRPVQVGRTAVAVVADSAAVRDRFDRLLAALPDPTDVRARVDVQITTDPYRLVIDGRWRRCRE